MNGDQRAAALSKVPAITLGFWIVKILAKQIDGELSLERKGQGTKFELRFAARNPED